MKAITLSHKTHKGKNILKRFGTDWRHFRSKDTVIFSSERGPWMLCAPKCDLNQIRWIHLTRDKDFIVEDRDK